MIIRTTYSVGVNDISCLEAGEKGKPVILLLHGIPASAEIWRRLLIRIALKGYYCIAPDLPGYGETVVRDRKYYSLPGAAALLNAWIAQQRLEKIRLVAHDLGGAVAQLMLTSHSQPFHSVTLSNVVTANTYPVDSIHKLVKAARLGLYFWFAVLGRFKRKQLFTSIAKLFIRDRSLNESDFDRIFFDGKFHQMSKARKFQNMLAQLNCEGTQANMAKLKLLKLPVHLLWAMDDPFQPWEKSGRILAEVFPHATVTKINNCGHYLQLDAGDEYFDKLMNQARA
jgi:pimeloyl-ACP methyl ester carboxylesterase